MNREPHERMGTADLVAGAGQQDQRAWGERQAGEAMAHGRDPQLRQQGGPGMPQQMEQRHAPEREPVQHGQAPQAMHGQPHGQPQAHGMEQLAALFPPEIAAEFRERWNQVQIGFVDDPRQAVQQADELVAQVMKRLAGSFAEQRSRLEASLGRDGQADTEDMRMALRGYRSFFQRLLSL